MPNICDYCGWNHEESNEDHTLNVEQHRRQRAEKEHRLYERGKSLAEAWSNLAEYNSKHAVNGLLRGFQHQHRTHQQAMVRLFVIMLERWVTDNTESNATDARNHDAWLFAQEIETYQFLFPIIRQDTT